jgi:hypothetical protein
VGAKRPAPVLQTAAGEPAGRLLQLIAETNLPKPYVVTDSIVIAPLTKTVREKLNALRSKRMVGNFMLAEALRRDDAKQSDIEDLTKIVADSDDEYNRLFFGDQHDAVMAFFGDRDPALWDAFCADINRQFQPTPPASGKCPHCDNVIDLEAAGKALASST